MSTKPTTAADILAKFKGASPATAAMYNRVLANRRSAPPSVFAKEAKPVHTTAAVIANARRSLPTIDTPVDEKFPARLAAHVRAGLRNLKSGRAAQDALMTLRDAIFSLHGDTNTDAARYLRTRNLRPLAIATSGLPTGGGYLTPDAVTGAIQLRLAEVGVARSLATIVPVTTGQSSTPYLDQFPAVDYVSEGGTIEDSTPSFGSLNAHVAKRASIIEVSNDLLADSAYAVLDMLIGAVANALGSVEDAEVILGDATSNYGGVAGLIQRLGVGGRYTPANGVGKSVWTGLDAGDFAGMFALLPERYCHPTNQFVMSSAFFATVMAEIPSAVSWDADGSPRLFGYRVLRSEKMPRATAVSQLACLFGDFPNAVTMADRGIVFAASDQAPGAFAEDVTLLRVVSRYDLIVHNYGDGSTAGAYVGLRTAAS